MTSSRESGRVPVARSPITLASRTVCRQPPSSLPRSVSTIHVDGNRPRSIVIGSLPANLGGCHIGPSARRHGATSTSWRSRRGLQRPVRTAYECIRCRRVDADDYHESAACPRRRLIASLDDYASVGVTRGARLHGRTSPFRSFLRDAARRPRRRPTTLRSAARSPPPQHVRRSSFTTLLRSESGAVERPPLSVPVYGSIPCRRGRRLPSRLAVSRARRSCCASGSAGSPQGSSRPEKSRKAARPRTATRRRLGESRCCGPTARQLGPALSWISSVA